MPIINLFLYWLCNVVIGILYLTIVIIIAGIIYMSIYTINEKDKKRKRKNMKII